MKGNPMEVARAPLRWAGSKRKSLQTLRRHFPSTIAHYIEPFAGSACLAFLIRPDRFVLGDINPQLIEFYRHLRNDPSKLHKRYRSFSSDPQTYYAVRSAYNDSAPSIARAARFLYLNRNCFNGIYRVNSAGDFNVPWGGGNVGKPLARVDLAGASKVLRNASLVCDDFERVVRRAVRPGSFVYLDPPFASNESRVFREYHQDSFATEDWARLISVLEVIDNAGAYFLLSYGGNSSLTKELDCWNIGYLDVTRNVGGFRASRRRHREFLASNYQIQQPCPAS